VHQSNGSRPEGGPHPVCDEGARRTEQIVWPTIWSNATKKLIEATCPYCGGSLGEIWNDDAGISEFVCMIGHQYAPRELLAAHYEAQKRALWAAVRALEELANVANAASTVFPEEEARQRRAKADRRIEQAAAIRKIVQALEPL
jgi:hypothetical protein